MNDRQRYVYFAQCDGLIKIGSSYEVRARLRALGADFLAAVPGGFPAERALHDRFAHAQVVSEWFSPTPDLLAYIAALPDEAKQVPLPSRPSGGGDVLLLSEAAKELRVSLRTVQRMVERGEMPGAVRIRGQWRVSRRRLDEYLHGAEQAVVAS